MADFGRMIGCDSCFGWFYFSDVGLRKGVKLGKHYCCPRCRELEELKKRESDLTKKLETYQRLEEDLISSSKPVRKEKGKWTMPKKTSKLRTEGGQVGIPLANKFAALEARDAGNEVSEEGAIPGSQQKGEDVVIAGSSNINRFRSHVFRNSEAKVRKIDVLFASLPGSRTEHLVGRVGDMISAEKKTKVYLHVGTNDVVKKGTTEIIENFRRIIRECKSGDRDVDVAVCSIPPRFDQGDYVFSKSMSVNNLLIRTCQDEGAEFFDLEPAFRRCRGEVIGRDGVHYSQAGAEIVGKALAVSIADFLG